MSDSNDGRSALTVAVLVLGLVAMAGLAWASHHALSALQQWVPAEAWGQAWAWQAAFATVAVSWGLMLAWFMRSRTRLFAAPPGHKPVQPSGPTAACSDPAAGLPDAASEGADHRKDVFLATLAHELRNPLAPIRNAAYVLQTANVAPERQAWAIDIINRQVGIMGRLLEDLLDMSRITLGTLALHKESVVIRGVVDAAIELARPALDQRRHTLAVKGDALDEVLQADPMRLAQALGNLLNNAAEYTDPGGHVEIVVQRSGEMIEIEVTDTGIGLAPTDLDRVFDMFAQVRTLDERADGGLGVGLALVRGLVGLHGGNVSALSEGPGRGSQFRIVLPRDVKCLPPEQMRRSEASRANLSEPVSGALRVLVVDDNADGADSLAALLRAAGHEVRVAYGGLEALQAALQRPADVAVVDIGMPRIDGHEVARGIRAMRGGESTHLIALTGWGQADDKLRTQATGFDRHLVKPVDPDLILELLADRQSRFESDEDNDSPVALKAGVLRSPSMTPAGVHRHV